MLVQTKPGFPFTPIARIPLQRNFIAFCDPKWLFALNALHWYAKKSRGKWYACAKVHINGKIKFLRMHRIVAHTPKSQIPHHRNGNSLDNREANLQNMTRYEHQKLYSWW